MTAGTARARLGGAWGGAAVAAAAAVVVAAAVPYVAPPYLLDQFSLALAYAIAILGLNLVTGYGGAVTLGHGAFFAVGAYTTAILAEHYGWAPLATVPVGAGLTWLLGLLFGRPALRLHGLYLALGTLALAITVSPLLKRFEPLTGGHQGIVVGASATPWGLGLDERQWLYLVTAAVAGVLALCARAIVRGSLGRALIAVRDNALVAGVMGVDRVRTMSLTFAVGSLYAGIGGAFYTMVVGYVSPDSFSVMLSLSFFIAGVVGGLTSISGAFYGALFIQFLPTWASDIDRALAGFAYGAALILTLLLMPEGVAGVVTALGRRLWPGRARHTSPDPTSTPGGCRLARAARR